MKVQELFEEDTQDEEVYFTIEVKDAYKEGTATFERMIEYIAQTVNSGSATEITVSSGGGEETFELDGDGGVSIKLVSKGEEDSDDEAEFDDLEDDSAEDAAAEMDGQDED
jgi:hypothetical protein